MKYLIIRTLRFYQKVLSPDTGIPSFFLPQTMGCRMEPSCSEYMILSVEKFGVSRGIFKGTRRILRCHPWQKHLVDFP